ncbi:unnamed protein product [Colletotrichum noveboracense]|uniref:Uncharacterized protein n=1 Tax=Colletotrichum noveboracense TaxID=2664923 RepID=A0A9W4WGS8_9PEZI|nr:unnamed protein product [Colletotrichum noveboracense]
MSGIPPESDLERQSLVDNLSSIEDFRSPNEIIATAGKYTSTVQHDDTCGLVDVIASGEVLRASGSVAANPADDAQNMNDVEDHREGMDHMRATIERDNEVVPNCDETAIDNSAPHRIAESSLETSCKSSQSDTGPERVENETESPMFSEVVQKAAWRPFWLRREVIVSFTAIYMTITITTLVMLWVAWRNESIGKA